MLLFCGCSFLFLDLCDSEVFCISRNRIYRNLDAIFGGLFIRVTELFSWSFSQHSCFRDVFVCCLSVTLSRVTFQSNLEGDSRVQGVLGFAVTSGLRIENAVWQKKIAMMKMAGPV